MTFTVKCDPSLTPPIISAMQCIQSSPNMLTVVEAVDTLRTEPWEVTILNREFPHPVRPIPGEETLSDLWSLLQTLMKSRGAVSVMNLYVAYGIEKLIDLRCSDYPQFAADVEAAIFGHGTRFSTA